MIYRIVVSKKVQKEIDNLPLVYIKKIELILRKIAEYPFKGKKLGGDYEGSYSVRVWPYRIIYKIKKEILTVLVVKVGHRKDVYDK